MQIERGERGVEVRRRGSAAVWEGELPFDTILSDGVKEVSSGEGDTLRREALQRNDSWGCGQVISCSPEQPRWRTELELCRCESFDDDHWATALGTAPQRVSSWSGRGFGFSSRWN